MKSHEPRGWQTANDGLKKKGAISPSSAVEVLLATYNGERFLNEQIDSILSQDYENLRVLARDDGSSDRTMEILSGYEQRFPDRFCIMPLSAATGSAKGNFLQLMKASKSEYICFADQDDVWLPNKISKTMQAMARLESRWKTTTPLLVFTDLRVVDDTLKTLHESFWQQTGTEPKYIGNLAALLQHNVVTGCTALINRRLLDMALHMPEDAAMHDSWIALLASAFGFSEMVDDKTVLYRQHDRNVIGITKRTNSPRELIARFLHREGRVLQWKINERQVKALLRIHGEKLSPKQHELLNAYLRCGKSNSRIARIAIMFRYRFFRHGLLRNLAAILDIWMRRMG